MPLVDGTGIRGIRISDEDETAGMRFLRNSLLLQERYWYFDERDLSRIMQAVDRSTDRHNVCALYSPRLGPSASGKSK